MARDYTTYDNNIRNELGSYLRNPTMAQPRVNQYVQPPRLNSDVSDLGNYANMASDLNNVWNTGSSISGLGGLSNAGANTAIANTMPTLNTSIANTMPTLNTSGLTMGNGGINSISGMNPSSIGMNPASNVSLNNFAGASKMLPMAAILAMGAFGMPSGKANLERYKQERRDKIIKEKINPFTGMMEGMSGMSNTDLLESQRPPQTPWEAEQAYIRGKELGSYRGQGTGGGGDQDYEVDSARQQWEMNPERDRINSEFLAQGNNSKWYNPDMSRTDYMGEAYANSPGLTKLADASRNFFIPGTTIPLGHDNPTQAAVAQYQDYTGNPQDFVPDVGSNVPSTQPTVEQPGLFGGEQPTRQGNIYGSDNRQTYNGKDLYADQTLYNSKKYKGY